MDYISFYIDVLQYTLVWGWMWFAVPEQYVKKNNHPETIVIVPLNKEGAEKEQ